MMEILHYPFPSKRQCKLNFPLTALSLLILLLLLNFPLWTYHLVCRPVSNLAAFLTVKDGPEKKHKVVHEENNISEMKMEMEEND
jgi:hypothetical protein